MGPAHQLLLQPAKLARDTLGLSASLLLLVARGRTPAGQRLRADAAARSDLSIGSEDPLRCACLWQARSRPRSAAALWGTADSAGVMPPPRPLCSKPALFS